MKRHATGRRATGRSAPQAPTTTGAAAADRPAADPPAADRPAADRRVTVPHTAEPPPPAEPPVPDGRAAERPAVKRGVVKYGALALLAACAVLVFAQCGAAGGSPSGGSAPASRGGDGFNSTDVMFLQMMLPHQEQGVKLVRLAKRHAVRPEVKTLAAAIETTQVAEAREMQRRLREWRRPLRAESSEHAAHGGMPETTDAELAALEQAPPDRFEREFLNLLIGHQDDAVQMARLEIGGGEDGWTKRLAERVDRSRSAQIDQMLAILRPPSTTKPPSTKKPQSTQKPRSTQAHRSPKSLRSAEGTRPPEDSHRK
ncbi:DUF305 domain-containing protein [Actinomadura sp. KC216]|uniref:DUF305 domain-containing protein n=1 Tax=Actinomadura sp. KC216 TaxID=2530370 RepID=UPI00104B24B9|nr:DUF305 domain-containing protein [Actinomadura sp. KC216]TDB80056.1 DUF305 domain-containing protein [Actinomadura sp. KC216]